MSHFPGRNPAQPRYRGIEMATQGIQKIRSQLSSQSLLWPPEGAGEQSASLGS